MNSLTVNGFGSDIRVERGRLHVREGRISPDKEPEIHVLKPKHRLVDNIIVNGHTGSVTFEAVRWLTKQDISLTFLDWNGKLLSSITPKTVKTKSKFAQYEAYKSMKRLYLAKKLVESKYVWHKEVLTWLKAKYPDVDNKIEHEFRILARVHDIPRIMNVEARMANIYWREIRNVIDPKWEFEGRRSAKRSRPKGAIDPINALLNYGYAVLESQCLKAINSVGLDPHVGFLHEHHIGKIPLAYDLQEPFRWLVDVAVIRAIENKVFNKKDFIITENYNIKLKPEGATKLVQEIDKILNERVEYKRVKRTWKYVITLKAKELESYLLGKIKTLNLTKPKPELKRDDTLLLREQILSLDQEDAKQLGIGKSQMHYLRKKARDNKEFILQERTRRKLK